MEGLLRKNTEGESSLGSHQPKPSNVNVFMSRGKSIGTEKARARAQERGSERENEKIEHDVRATLTRNDKKWWIYT